jgi:hypothetical protein
MLKATYFHRMNKILYNVTCSVDENIHEEWLDWMKFVHIPDVMRTGLFIENKICRIKEFEENGITYAVQYTCRNRADYDRYQREFAPGLQAHHLQKYGEKVVAFRTVLEIIHEVRSPFVDVSPN